MMRLETATLEPGQVEAPTSAAACAETAPATARIDGIDAVRGLALGGMLLVNLQVFSGAEQAPLLYQTGADWAAGFLTLLLAEGKFYPLFAFLFGWGIARRQGTEAGKPGRFLWRNLRRISGLAVFGLLHAVLLWQGDILFAYALIGMLLPLLHRLPGWGLIALAGAGLLLDAFLHMPIPGGELYLAYAEWINGLLGNPWLGFPGRSPWAVASPVNFYLVQFIWKLAYAPDWLGNFAALILAGYAWGMGHTFRLPRMPVRAPQPRIILLFALPLNLFYALTGAYPYVLPPDWSAFLRTLAISLGGPLLGLWYALLVLRWYRSPGGQRLLEPLRRIGRMPLTTYLGQSLIGALFFPWSWHGEFAPWLVWPLAAGIFLAQLLFAGLWYKRFRQGPLEWLWRRLSGSKTPVTPSIPQFPR